MRFTEAKPRNRLRHSKDFTQPTEDGLPLRIDLQAALDEVFALMPEGVMNREDYNMLVGLIGGQTVDRIIPTHKQEAQKLLASIQGWDPKMRPSLHSVLALAKLYDPEHFPKKHLELTKLKRYLDERLITISSHTEDYLSVASLMVLFPEEKKKILDAVEVVADSWLARIKTWLEEPGRNVHWEDLVALKFTGIRPKEVQQIIKQHWHEWQEEIRFSLNSAKERESRRSRDAFLSAALGLACGMYILSAEKAVINEKGLPEVTPPPKQKMVQPPELPTRDLAS